MKLNIELIPFSERLPDPDKHKIILALGPTHDFTECLTADYDEDIGHYYVTAEDVEYELEELHLSFLFWADLTDHFSNRYGGGV